MFRSSPTRRVSLSSRRICQGGTQRWASASPAGRGARIPRRVLRAVRPGPAGQRCRRNAAHAGTARLPPGALLGPTSAWQPPGRGAARLLIPGALGVVGEHRRIGVPGLLQCGQQASVQLDPPVWGFAATVIRSNSCRNRRPVPSGIRTPLARHSSSSESGPARIDTRIDRSARIPISAATCTASRTARLAGPAGRPPRPAR